MFLYGGHEGELVALHNAKCAMKEEAMPYGIAAMTSAVIGYLNKQSNAKIHKTVKKVKKLID